MRIQDVASIRVASLMSQCHGRRTFYCMNLAYDETEVNLSLDFDSSLDHGQQVSRWHVMISSSSSISGAISSSPEDNVPAPMRLMPAMAPTAVLSTNAPTLHHALFCTSSGKAFVKLCMFHFSSADLASFSFARDYAGPNGRVNAHFAATHPNVCISDKVCSLHGQKTVEQNVAIVAGLHFISHLYSASLLLRMGGYYVRFIQAVDLLVDNHATLIRGEPPLGAKVYADEVIDYVLSNFSCSAQQKETLSSSGAKRPKAKARSKAKARGKSSKAKVTPLFVDKVASCWRDLASVLNGRWYAPDDFMCHWCTDAKCCANPDTGRGYCLDTCKAKIKRCLKRTVYRHYPVVPHHQKWAKLGGNLDWNMAGNLVQGMHGRAYRAAFDRSFAASVEERAVKFDSFRTTSDFRHDFNWHRLVGVRVKSIRALYDDESAATSTINMLTIVEEPLRYVLRFFLGGSSAVQDPCLPPPLCTVANPWYSPLTVARQAFSMLLAGLSPRLAFLFKPDGCNCFEQWVDKFPRKAVLLRRFMAMNSILDPAIQFRNEKMEK
jgi:hypothetical protein